jgi:malonyl-CoA O-methyltransferase
MPTTLEKQPLTAYAAPDKPWVRHSFNRAAAGYDGVAALQRHVGDRLIEALSNRSIQPRAVIDIGCGTGHCAERLARRFPQARLIALDLAEGMLRQARRREELAHRAVAICADAEALPLADRSVDLVFTNLAVQWCGDLSGAFREFRRVLRGGGILCFSTFGPGTLHELRQAWAAVDRYSHVNEFRSLAEIENALRNAGLGDLQTSASTESLLYADIDGLMRELKGLGAHNVTADRPRHLLGKNALQAMRDAYPGRRPDGRVQASFEVIQGFARGA